MKKTLKVLSVIMFIFAVLSVIFSVLALAGGGILGKVAVEGVTTSPEEEEVAQTALAAGALIITAGVLLFISGMFEQIACIYGVRGANGTPSCAGKAKVLACISLVFSLASAVLSIESDQSATNIISSSVGIVMQFFFIYVAYRVQHEENNVAAN